jgi:ABC-type Mn2+/Zn2+ transport system ATPase subunit
MHGVGAAREPAIYVDGLAASHGRGRGDVFENVTFRIDPGEFVALMGPNGCGKTTLLRVLLGELPARGSIVIHGHQRGGAILGYVPQAYEWERDFPITVGEVVLAGRRSSRRLIGRSKPADRAKVTETIGRLGLTGLSCRAASSGVC